MGFSDEGCPFDVIFFQLADENYDCRIEHVQQGHWYYMELKAVFGLVGGVHTDPIERLEFRVEDWIGEFLPEGMGNEDGNINVDWHVPVVGDLETGVTVLFDPPISPDVSELLLAEIEFVVLSDSVLNSYHWMQVVEGKLTDIYGQVYSELAPGWFVFNEDYEDHFCFMLTWVTDRDLHVQNISPELNSEVFGVFDFGFRAISRNCVVLADRPFTGEVLLDGEVLYEFDGVGAQSFSFPIDVTVFSPGDEIVMGIALHADQIDNLAELTYLVMEPTAVEDLNFSKLKSLY
jgi:hypothetical protein